MYADKIWETSSPYSVFKLHGKKIVVVYKGYKEEWHLHKEAAGSYCIQIKDELQETKFF